MKYTVIEQAHSQVPDEEKSIFQGEAYCSMPEQAFSDAAKLYFTSKNNNQVYVKISFLPPRKVWVFGRQARLGQAQRYPCRLQFYVEQSVGLCHAYVSSSQGDSFQQPSSFNTAEKNAGIDPFSADDVATQ